MQKPKKILVNGVEITPNQYDLLIRLNGGPILNSTIMYEMQLAIFGRLYYLYTKHPDISLLAHIKSCGFSQAYSYKAYNKFRGDFEYLKLFGLLVNDTITELGKLPDKMTPRSVEPPQSLQELYREYIISSQSTNHSAVDYQTWSQQYRCMRCRYALHYCNNRVFCSCVPAPKNAYGEWVKPRKRCINYIVSSGLNLKM